MKYRQFISTALVSAISAGASAGVWAQAQESKPLDEPAVLTDVGPPPAHDRGSIGAVLVDDSLLRPQRDRSFDDSDPKAPRAKAATRKAQGAQARKPAKSSSMGQSGRSSP